jgi:hypothetical protein
MDGEILYLFQMKIEFIFDCTFFTLIDHTLPDVASFAAAHINIGMSHR